LGLKKPPNKGDPRALAKTFLAKRNTTGDSVAHH
jgi:hypothetical protein